MLTKETGERVGPRIRFDSVAYWKCCEIFFLSITIYGEVMEIYSHHNDLILGHILKFSKSLIPELQNEE